MQSHGVRRYVQQGLTDVHWHSGPYMTCGYGPYVACQCGAMPTLTPRTHQQAQILWGFRASPIQHKAAILRSEAATSDADPERELPFFFFLGMPCSSLKTCVWCVSLLLS